jgi:hypothetical protein
MKIVKGEVMINEQRIISIFQNRHRYEAEVAILRDCSDVLNDTDQAKPAARYAILKRKVALIDHWLSYLSYDERMLIEKHLIEGLSWSRIASQIASQQEIDIPRDERTLQRLQAKAVKKISTFMQDSFADIIDDLIENED